MRIMQLAIAIAALLSELILVSCAQANLTSPEKDQAMTTLGIDLQEGFTKDQVVITINGKEEFREENVTTKLLLGYAQQLSYQVPEGTKSILVSLPKKGFKRTIDLDLQEDTYLGISVTPTGIEYIASETEFTYQ